jgi:glycosyltransferase involved in cell wall biosynthesis
VARILMIAYTTYVHDGRVKRHAQALAQRGDHIDVICLENAEQGMRDGVNVIGLQLARYRGSSRINYLRTYLRFFAAATMKAIHLSRIQPYDVAIVCTMPDAAVLCAIPTRFFGSKVVLDVHDTMPELYADKFGGRRGALGARLLQLEEQASAWAADRVLAVHEPHRQRLIRAGVHADKISVVLNMPDPRIFSYRPISFVAQSNFTVVCHGTIARRLGLDVAIDAMDILRERLPAVRFLVIGSGDYLDEIKAKVRRHRLDLHVSFKTPVALESLPQVLRGAAIGLVPNRSSQATELMLPVKLLEYAALGIPVIAARLHTIEHYFSRAVRFFEPGDSADLAQAIEQLYRDSALRRRLAESARRTMDAIDWKVQRQNYYEAIDSLLSPDIRRASDTNVAMSDEQPSFNERRIQVE